MTGSVIGDTEEEDPYYNVLGWRDDNPADFEEWFTEKCNFHLVCINSPYK